MCGPEGAGWEEPVPGSSLEGQHWMMQASDCSAGMWAAQEGLETWPPACHSAEVGPELIGHHWRSAEGGHPQGRGGNLGPWKQAWDADAQKCADVSGSTAPASGGPAWSQV